MAFIKMKLGLIHPQIPLFIRVRNCNTVASSPNFTSLLTKLIRAPLHGIKETMDSEEKDQSSPLRSPCFSLEALVSALRDASFLKKANLVVEWKLEKFIKENERDRDSYSRLIMLSGKIQNFETAIRIFSSMEAQGIRPTSSVFNTLVSACLSSNNFVTALSFYELMEISEEYKSDSDTYNAFILAYANQGNKKAMQAWYSARIAAGFSPGLQTYDALILGCLKSKDFGDAERAFEEMISAGFVPNLSILQNMLLVYTTQKIFCKIRQNLMLVLDSSLKINRYTAEKVVSLYYELGKVKEMEELLVAFTKSKQDSGILSFVHSMIIRLYVVAGKLDDVEFSVGRMLKQGISFRYPDDVEQIFCLYFRHAAYERLDLFLECIKDSYKLRTSSYDILVAGYRRAGLQEKLDMVIDNMRKNGFVVS